MLTELATIDILGLKLYTYGFFLTLGVLFAIVLAYFVERKTSLKKGTLLLTICISMPLGVALSRLLYCLTDSNFRAVLTFKNIFLISTGGMSMYGAILAVILAALISAKILSENTRKMLDAITAPLMAFILFARLGESYTQLGISRPLVTGVLEGGFLVHVGEYDAYLKTWLLEAVCACVLCVLLYAWLNKYKKGDVFLSWMILFGATQVIFESLRYDGHMRFSFVGLQQVLSSVLWGIALLILSLRKKPMSKRAKINLFLLPVAVFGAIGIEFLIDRSEIQKWLLYIGYIALLALPSGIALSLREKTHE